MDKLQVYVKIKISKPKLSEITKLQNDLNSVPKIIPCKNNATYCLFTEKHIVKIQKYVRE